MASVPCMWARTRLGSVRRPSAKTKLEKSGLAVKQAHPIEKGGDIGFIQHGGVSDYVADAARGAFTEFGEPAGRVCLLPTAFQREPARHGEVGVSDHQQQGFLAPAI